MTKMSLEYNGQLRTKLVHDSSKAFLLTDAPVDNHGLGESFSPTDLVASGLAACMITVLGIQNETKNLGILAMEATAEKHMKSNPRRISEIKVELKLKMKNRSTESHSLIREIAEHCPVAQSLSKDLNQILSISFT
ncbi:MAG: OsmC family protein [Flavobacteriales bacterium]